MRISDWSSDVCSSDLRWRVVAEPVARAHRVGAHRLQQAVAGGDADDRLVQVFGRGVLEQEALRPGFGRAQRQVVVEGGQQQRSEEHTSELQSLMRISYAVFCLKIKNIRTHLEIDINIYIT